MRLRWLEISVLYLLPSRLQNQPLSDEVEAILATYKDHVDNALSDNITKHIIGFKYHREHNCYLRSDCDFTLRETVFVQPVPQRKVLLGNRVVDMLQGGLR